MIEDSNPDIIIGTETWLDTGIKSSEILTNQLGYDLQRRDRPNDPHGGVLVASKFNLQIGDVIVSMSLELLSANITLEKKKKFWIAAFYRPPNKTDVHHLQTVKNELSQLKARSKKTPLLIEGDFNLPDIHWKDLTVASSQYASRVNTTFPETIADFNLEQLVVFPTRKDNTLDIILKTHPSFKQRCKPIPSIGSSDHDIVLLDMYSTAIRPKPICRKTHLWKQADTLGLKDDLTDLADSVIVPDDIDTTWTHGRT